MDEVTRVRLWIESFINRDQEEAASLGQWALPFSFDYGGEPIAPRVLQWRRTQSSSALTDGVTSCNLTHSEEATGLAVEWRIRLFQDFPAVEWVLYLSNQGECDTPVISDLKCLRARFDHLSSPIEQGLWIDTLNGGRSLADDFMPCRFSLGPWEPVELDSPGTASNIYLPFFNLSAPESDGVWLALGWWGPWKARFYQQDGAPVIEAGIRQTYFRLRPKERVRGARILLMLWEGDRLRAQNMGRQLVLKHYVPKTFGDSPVGPLTTNVCFTYDGQGGFLEQANAENVLRETPFYGSLGIDYLVIDAGWYELDPADPTWFANEGNWRLDRTRYPEGIGPIASTLASSGARLAMWFTPMDNDSPNSMIAKEHPEFLLGPQQAIVDMSNPAAREWMLERIDELCAQGMSGYRTDGGGSFDEDAPDRVGIAQMKQVEGAYTFWDEIMRRHPGIIMEGCCGGGRSVELETISRFSVHQKSDRWFHSEEDQLSQYGFNMFLPGSILNLPTAAWDDYGFRSSMAAQICLGWNPFREDFDEDKARALVARYKELRHLLIGDYYPMTPLGMRWLAMQFHRADLGKGMALVFRRRTTPLGDDLAPSGMCDPPVARLRFRGLEPRASYIICSENTGESIRLTGEALQAGYDVTLPPGPSSEVLTYSRMTSERKKAKERPISSRARRPRLR